jgi:hypothetical protein
MKSGIIVGDTFGLVFQVQMTWHKLFWKVKGRLEMPMMKIIGCIWIEMIEEGKKKIKKKIGFQVGNKVANVYKISCLHLFVTPFAFLCF